MTFNWSDVERDSDELIKLNSMRDALNVSARAARRACLGSALGLESDAIQLVLTDHRDVALSYFDAISSMASSALENGETYIFKGPDGGKSFARYMSYRALSTAEWFLNGQRRSEYLAAMLDALQLSLRLESGARDEEEPRGHELLHLAQIGLWRRIVDTKRGSKGFVGVWGGFAKRIGELALALTTGAEIQPAATSFDGWFRTDVLRPGRLSFVAAGLTSADALTIAEIRAAQLFGVHEAWAVCRTLRWPDELASSN